MYHQLRMDFWEWAACGLHGSGVVSEYLSACGKGSRTDTYVAMTFYVNWLGVSNTPGRCIYALLLFCDSSRGVLLYFARSVGSSLGQNLSI